MRDISQGLGSFVDGLAIVGLALVDDRALVRVLWHDLVLAVVRFGDHVLGRDLALVLVGAVVHVHVDVL